jgi:hypothetical protein
VKNGRNGLVHYKDYVAGWFDSSIASFIESLARAPRGMEFALITALDSDLSPRKLLSTSPELAFLAKAARPVGAGFLVPTSFLLGAKEGQHIFYGFDEVWFFARAEISRKPAGAWLVGPNRLNETRLNKLGPWMAANACSLGLGDGEGLNVVLKARGAMKHLLAYSMSQQSEMSSTLDDLGRG